MLKRVYIDNYKSLVNVEIALKEINLFLGANGAGKSAVFEVLKKVRGFVCEGEKITSVFSPTSRTRWQSSSFQTVELEIEGNGGTYKYELEIEYKDNRRARVKSERLLFDDQLLLGFELGDEYPLEFEPGDVHLYGDDFSAVSTFSVDSAFSAVGIVPPRHNNTLLTWFKERLSRFVIVQIIPPMMDKESSEEEPLPSSYLENYVSWYRYISQDQGLAFKLMDELKQVLPGFDHFKFERVGEEHRLLKVFFQNEDDDKSLIGYNFDELSDGQQMLIALYSLLYAARADQKYGYTLCLDEPENFVALPEIQPWLTQVYDSCMDGEMQAVLISHHPELINYLLASPVGYWFERSSNRPTRVKSIAAQGQDGLAVSELVARGWFGA